MNAIDAALNGGKQKDSEVVRKDCNNCQGKGTVEVYSSDENYKDGYFYASTGTLMCKECNGAGVVNYKIVTKEI